MQRRRLASPIAFVTGMTLVAGLYGAVPAGQSAAAPGAGATDVEDIYIGRSWRESRQPPTDFCAPERTGFGRASVEDTYTFRSSKPAVRMGSS